jgi:hypothetical protein
MLLITVSRPLHMLVSEPIVTFVSLYQAFVGAVFFGFFKAFPYLFWESVRAHWRRSGADVPFAYARWDTWRGWVHCYGSCLLPAVCEARKR